MPKVQIIISAIFILLFFSQARATTCEKYSIHGRVENQNNKIVLLVNKGSRSETIVYLPTSLQNALKSHVSSRIEMHIPLEKKNEFVYQAYFIEDQVSYYPFTIEKSDMITLDKDSQKINCESKK